LIPFARRISRLMPGLYLFPLLIVAGAFLCLALAAPVLRAQTFDASTLREPADLDSPWLIHAGDDPAFAGPDFDDSQWTLFDPHKDIKTLFPASRPDVIWYRLHVKVDSAQTGMALREFILSRAFEIYVNGERLIAAGQITPFVPYTMNARPLARIPDRMLAIGSLVIALRVHISPTEWTAQGPGYDAGNLTIGQWNTLYRDDWLTVIGENSFTWLDHLLLIALGIAALMLFAAQPRQTEYLWLAALGLLTLAEWIEPLVSVFANFPLHWEALSDCIRVASPIIWVSLYFSFVHQRMGWRWRVFLVFAGLMNAFSAIQGLYLQLPLLVQFFSNLPFIILLSVVIPIVLATHWRRGNREAGILLIPALLFSSYIYAEIGFEVLSQFPSTRDLGQRGLNLIDRYPAGPFSISLDNLSDVLSMLALTIILLLRSIGLSRRQAILEGELAAAQEVQQVLVPEQIEAVQGFDVESVYEPAQQVGGDFFQVLPAENDGLLVVVGDVAGKGLPAAMLVSVLVGAIRGVAEYTVDPAKLLASLNERLIGRTHGGFSTALAAHITEDGWVTVANAGHLSPYLDGRELELPGALPLGVISGNTYETKQFYLAHGSRLTFYSDGVVEAQNAQGELFGFERARAISTQTAAEIVAAAKQFGQEDDITVVAIARHFAMATAA
jgi:phosphoserine phosphatase RsbU/P